MNDTANAAASPASTPLAAPEAVHRLVRQFAEQQAAFRQPSYNEQQLRIDFLNPMLEALGWDVANAARLPEVVRDVVYEDRVKVGGATKAPDYGLRLGGIRKFFVEAKKPSVDLKVDARPAYQLRRYAWSAKLPLSILTDFEEWAVYDCRIKPLPTDSSAVARLFYLRHDELADRWAELAGWFGRDAVQAGALERFAAENRRKRGTEEVDDAFLADLEGWRELLARNIALRNTGLSVRALNEAVQQTLDRIIFLRICEDRGIEAEGQLQGYLNGTNVYARLAELFRRADDRYNSGLFHFKGEKGRSGSVDDWTLGLTIDDKVLKDILKKLYFPESPYEFSVIPADILGQVYERFLGKVIRLTPAGRAVIEEKPEVRKAGGVYYTPTFVVDYIVQHTVGPLLEGKTPAEAAALRIVDPACGSGSFLLGAYQYLLDWHLSWYTSHDPKKHKTAVRATDDGGWRLTTAERKRILTDNIYGVDIDPQAVEVTKLSLVLKVLEGETDETLGGSGQARLLQERALPDLGHNVQCGNSLIGTDVFEGQQLKLLGDEETATRINAFDWDKAFPEVFVKGGFSVVIGNPPYDVLEKARGAASWPHAALSDYVRLRPEYKHALGGKTNLFRFFLIRSIALARPHAAIGMIVPLALLGDISCAQTRQFIINQCDLITADCFPQKDNAAKRIFFSAKLSTVIITCRHEVRPDKTVAVRVYPANRLEDSHSSAHIKVTDALLLDPRNAPIPLVNSTGWKVCLKIHQHRRVCRLGELQDYEITRGEINQTTLRRYIFDDAMGARFVKGVEIGRYCVNSVLSQGKQQWFDEVAYLRDRKPNLVTALPRLVTQRITGVDERLRIVATLMDPPLYLADSTNSITQPRPTHYRLEYLLACLNSRLFQWRFKLTSTNNNVATNELKCMPVRMIDFSAAVDLAYHDHLVALVQRMLDLHKRLPELKSAQDRTVVQRQIEATDREIDRLVYALYELTEEEIGIVEGRGG